MYGCASGGDPYIWRWPSSRHLYIPVYIQQHNLGQMCRHQWCNVFCFLLMKDLNEPNLLNLNCFLCITRTEIIMILTGKKLNSRSMEMFYFYRLWTDLQIKSLQIRPTLILFIVSLKNSKTYFVISYLINAHLNWWKYDFCRILIIL